MANPGRMQFREPAKKVLAKYEWGLGTDNDMHEARIRPFQFTARMEALNSRRSFPTGFEADMLPEDKRPQGPDLTSPWPNVLAKGIRGRLQRLFAGPLIKRLARLSVDWHAVAAGAARLRLEMLRDLVLVRRELDYFHEIANNRDLEAFETAQKLSGERKNNEDIANAYRTSEKLLAERREEVARLEVTAGAQSETIEGQSETIEAQKAVIDKQLERIGLLEENRRLLEQRVELLEELLEKQDKMLEVIDALVGAEDDDEDAEEKDGDPETFTHTVDPESLQDIRVTQ